MLHTVTRLSLATALLMGAALPVMAQGSSPATPVPGPRPAVTSMAPAAPAATSTPAVRPATPAPLQAARPATSGAPVAQPGGTAQPQAPRLGVATTPGTNQQAATPARPVAPRAN